MPSSHTTNRNAAGPADGPASEQTATWKDRRLLVLLGSDFLSLLGDYSAALALTVTAMQTMGAKGAGLALAAGGVPRVVLTALGGVLVERADARKLLIACHIVRGVALSAVALAWSAVPSTWLLLATLAFLGITAAAADPAGRSLLPQLADRPFLVRVLSARTLINRLAAVAGAPVGGALVLWGGYSAAVVLDATSFLAAAAALSMLRIPPALAESGGRQGVMRELLEGWRYAAGHPLIAPALLLLTGMNLVLSGPVQLGVVELSLQHGWGADGAGWIRGCFAIGSAASALTLAGFGHRLSRLGLWALAGALAASASLWLLAASSHLPVAMAASLSLGIGGNLLGGLLSGIVQGSAPTAMTGRIASLLALSTLGIWSVSCALAGLVLHAAGPTTTLEISAAAAVLVSLYGAARSSLRRARHTPEAPTREGHA